MRGVVHMWHNPTLVAAAFREWQAGRPPGSVALASSVAPAALSLGDPPDETALEAQAWTLHFWFQTPWLWRVVTTSNGAVDTYVAIDEHSWHWNGSVLYAEESLSPHEEPPNGIPPTLAFMLMPESLSSHLLVAESGRVVIAARDAADLRATPIDPDEQLWPGADEFRLARDAREPLLLRLEILRSGKTLFLYEFVDLETNLDLPADTFRLEIPSGVATLRTPREDSSGGPQRTRPPDWPRVRPAWLRRPWTNSTK